MNRINECLHALEMGELEKAYRIKDDIVAQGDDEEIFVLAEQLGRLGFLQEVIPLYEKLLEHYPEEGELLVVLAEVYMNLDRDEEAFLLLERIQRDDPVYLESLLLLADLYQKEGLFEVCEQKLLEAETLSPEDPVIQFALAEFYRSVGKFLEAVYKYEQILGTSSTIGGVDIHERLAEIYSATGEFEKAIPHYEKALEEKVKIDTLFGLGFTFFQAGYYRSAIEKLLEVKALDPDYESVYFPLAEAYEKEGELQSAMETAEEGMRVNPFNKELAFFAGNLSVKRGKTTVAEQYFRKALELDPEYVEAVLSLNRLLFREGRYIEAIELMAPLIEDGEEDPDLLWDYALSCQHEEKYSEALSAYQSAYKYLKENGEFLQNYGFFLLEAGIKGDAIEVFKQLLNIDPTNVDYIDVLERLEADRL